MGRDDKMGKIEYRYYDDYRNYPRFPKYSKIIDVSRDDLFKYAVTNGFFNSKSLSIEEIMFYSSFEEMAIEENNNSAYISSDGYEGAETSYKNNISFAIGMIAARIIAEKEYHIPQLFHLNDQSVKYTTINGKSAPDWFGLDWNNKSFLFESKGSSKASGLNSKVKTAKKQLNSISEIEYLPAKSNGNSEDKPEEIEKHAIISWFENVGRNSGSRIWHIDDVDPIGEGIVVLEIDFNKQCFDYYKPFISLLKSKPDSIMEEEIGQQKYYFIYCMDKKIGIHKNIYDAFVSDKYTEENKYANFYKDIKKILSEIKCEKYIKDSSSYEDGIIVCSSK